jgi:hypothetical protein
MSSKEVQIKNQKKNPPLQTHGHAYQCAGDGDFAWCSALCAFILAMMDP